MPPLPPPPSRTRSRQLWMGLGWPLAVVVLVFGIGAVLPLPRNQILWGGFGIVLALLTVARPWWFWEHPKARWLRGLIGDDATALVYFAAAPGWLYAAMAGWCFGR